jgi:alkylhydroperoxidase/carboxymuconolactone decarboxylase family protein YurZ
MSHVLTPIEGPFDPDVDAVLATYPRRDGYLLSLFRVFANSRRFLRKGVANLLDRDSPLPMRQREIVILRVTANLDCEYEWGVHVAAFAKHVGLTAAQVAATRERNAGSWPAEEALLIRVVDELCGCGTLTDATLAAFQQSWDLAAQLEILALCGNYHTISFVANVARLPGEAFAERFPEAG